MLYILNKQSELVDKAVPGRSAGEFSQSCHMVEAKAGSSVGLIDCTSHNTHRISAVEQVIDVNPKKYLLSRVVLLAQPIPRVFQVSVFAETYI